MSVIVLNLICANPRLSAADLKLFERSHYQINIQQIRQQRIRLVSPQIFRRVHASRSHRQDARAEMPRTGNVIGRVANHNKLLGPKINSEMFVYSLRRNCRQVATVE